MSKMRSRSWGIALTAVLSAVYVAYAVLSSYLIGYVTHGVDNFIVRSLVFVVLVAMTVRFGYCTIMGGVTGVVLEFAIPTPVPFYLVLSLLAYGLVIDGFVNFRRDISIPPSFFRLLLGTVFASLAMSSTALAVFTLVGFFPVQTLPFIWGVEIAVDVTLGVIGGVIGVALVQRVTHLK
jgi:hypothetical protein